jgi:PTH1 family peptidyl-tRNA hydrolase
MVIDLIAARWGRPAFRDKWRAQNAVVELPGSSAPEKVYLMKPQTFMNLSGDSIQPAAAFLRHPPAEILVIHDELDLPLGRLQLKEGGGAGGHNGLKSITERLGTPNYNRLRCGIGRPPVEFRGTPADFVLQGFAPFETIQVQDLVSRAAEAVELLVQQGMSAAMNQINRRNS